MQRIFAIGDVHGCAKTLKRLLINEITIERSDHIYFLGDYIDRGPDSKGVIDFILELKNNAYDIHTLRGNHEQLFINSGTDAGDLEIWISNQGNMTLQSFGISGFSELEDVYQSFFNETKLYFDTENYIFVHAGLNFNNENIFRDRYAMLWIRDMKINKSKIGNKIIVHGHTPTPLYEVKLNLKKVKETQEINIDTGAWFKTYYGYGFLSALELSTMQLYSTKNID